MGRPTRILERFDSGDRGDIIGDVNEPIDANASARARSLPELVELFGRLADPERLPAAEAMDPRPDDVFISPFAKCGTTRLQMIVHTLRTRGDLDFDDISRVVPWVEVAASLGQRLDEDQRGWPRAFKSHLGWDEIPKPGRYIVSLRDPKDAVVSGYRFMEGWMFEPGSIDIGSYIEAMTLPADRRRYWEHLRSWWGQRSREDVLLLSFADMNVRPEETIRVIASFIGIDLDEELLALTVERSSLSFMKEHQHLFDDLMMRERSHRVAGVPLDSDSTKVRDGVVGSHRTELPDTISTALDEVWAEEIAAQLGIADFATLDAIVTSETTSALEALVS